MSFNKNMQEGICHMSLVGDIKIYDVASYKQEMFSELEGYKGIKLDVSQIEDIDVSGFQLLILLRKEARQRSISFELVGTSSPVTRLLEMYRLSDWFFLQE